MAVAAADELYTAFFMRENIIEDMDASCPLYLLFTYESHCNVLRGLVMRLFTAASCFSSLQQHLFSLQPRLLPL